MGFVSIEKIVRFDSIEIMGNVGTSIYDVEARVRLSSLVI